nr:unnamed protein product [Callosobruchus analis]
MARGFFDVVGWSSKSSQRTTTSCLLVRSSSDDCSHLVQDIGSEEELSFGYQTNVSLMSPCQSLQAELSQVHIYEDESENNETGTTKDFVESLKSENRTLRAKVEELTAETDHLYAEISKLEEHVERLEKALKKSEENHGNTTCGDVENTLVGEVQKKLEQLQQEYAQLQERYASKELEVEEHKKKFNFEMAYKNAQKELNEKFQLLSELQKEAGNYKSTICKLTNDNRALETALEELKERLKEKEEVWNLHKDIEGMASQVQTHIDKKNDIMDELVNMKDTLRERIGVLEDKLRKKHDEVEHLEDILKSQEQIKNVMWRDNKDLLKQVEVLTIEKQKLADEVQELSAYKDTINNVLEGKQEFTNLEDKSCKLCDEVSQFFLIIRIITQGVW